MKKSLSLLALPLLLSAAPAWAAHDPDTLRDAALSDTLAYEITEGLTTEVGQRLAATEAEARARDWAVKKLKALGFAKVRAEPFMMPAWERGAETVEVVGPFKQKLVVAALGNSGATAAEGVTAEVVYFPTLADLEAAPDAKVKGRIVFVSHAMKAAQDGSGYGPFGAARRQGPAIASRKGAAAILIRSIGTDYHRNPHTGGTSWNGATPIAAGALPLPDAEQLERILKRGKPVTLKLIMTPRFLGQRESGNVIAEVPGRDPKAGAILIACHLDSWDLGTGAIDDASGCGIVTAAAKRIMAAGAPRRTIRILWAGAEEPGVFGGDEYGKQHVGVKHSLAMESDFGADRVWKATVKLPDAAKPVLQQLTAALAPLGIPVRAGDANGGADTGAIAAAQKLSMIDLEQDGARYFDLHHTPDDTLDKVDPVQLAQNVAAWTATLAVVANAGDEIDPQP